MLYRRCYHNTLPLPPRIILLIATDGLLTATTMGNQAQTTNKVTGCTLKKKEMTTFSSDVYPPPPYTQHNVSTVAKAKGTYNNNELKTTTTTTTKMDMKTHVKS